jgi:hypothetical protein
MRIRDRPFRVVEPGKSIPLNSGHPDSKEPKGNLLDIIFDEKNVEIDEQIRSKPGQFQIG